jgi:formylglycine-generating enzyme required for sulfatase activity
MRKPLLLTLLLLGACGPAPSSNPGVPTPTPSNLQPSQQPSATPSLSPTPIPMPTVGSSAVPEPTPSPTMPPVAEVPATVTNSQGMTFVRIESGTFLMGSPADESGRKNDETQHTVTLSQPFLLQTTEVTQRQWRAIMGENPSLHQQPDDPARPVENITWDQLQTFIARLNERRDGTYRLPTEAEWEYAARAGSNAIYSFGSNPRFLGNYAWFAGSLTGLTSRPQPVGQKQPNGFGLYDMTGNVAEFVQDNYGAWSAESVTDPVGPASSAHRVYRGCSYADVAESCRIAARHIVRPNQAPESGTVGFRLVRLAP